MSQMWAETGIIQIASLVPDILRSVQLIISNIPPKSNKYFQKLHQTITNVLDLSKRPTKSLAMEFYKTHHFSGFFFSKDT